MKNYYELKTTRRIFLLRFVFSNSKRARGGAEMSQSPLLFFPPNNMPAPPYCTHTLWSKSVTGWTEAVEGLPPRVLPHTRTFRTSLQVNLLNDECCWSEFVDVSGHVVIIPSRNFWYAVEKPKLSRQIDLSQNSIDSDRICGLTF